MRIDAKAGTHFIGKIFVTPHALDRVTQHFGVDRAGAPMWVMDRLRKASLVDPDVIGEDGVSRRLFVYQRVVYIVAQNEDTVVTVYQQETAPEDVRGNVGKVLTRALKAAQRAEQRELRRLAIERAELNVRQAGLELRRLQTNLATVKRKIDEELVGIAAEMSRIEAEVYAVKREKSTLAKGICAYIA
jgi:ribosomal protein L20